MAKTLLTICAANENPGGIIEIEGEREYDNERMAQDGVSLAFALCDTLPARTLHHLVVELYRRIGKEAMEFMLDTEP